MEQHAITEPPKTRTWSEFASDAIHNTHVQEAAVIVGLGVGVAAAVASRGKLSGAMERFFPSNASLLTDISKADSAVVPSVMKGNEALFSKSAQELMTLATKTDTSPKVLAHLADHAHPEVLLNVAKNRAAEATTLEKISRGAVTPDIAKALASHSNASAEVLGNVATIAPSEVARHANTLPETLSNIATREVPKIDLDHAAAVVKRWGDRPQDVINNLLENPNTPIKTIESLPFDHRAIDPFAQYKAVNRLVQSRETTPDSLSRILANKRLEDHITRFGVSTDYLKAAAEHPNKL